MADTHDEYIPVVDVFAGPGGLGEGFSSFKRPDGSHPFKLVLSVEKDYHAHRTLRLRSFYRQFQTNEVPACYYQLLRGEINESVLAEPAWARSSAVTTAWNRATSEALQAELGACGEQDDEIRQLIRASVSEDRPWVLIGGPPCQAYSVVGRARNKGVRDYRIEDDARHQLYREYLKIIADRWPTMFVMENVKGMLSATVSARKIFDRILNDLHNPAASLSDSNGRKGYRYSIRSVVCPPSEKAMLFDFHKPSEFVVKCENHGVPQERHRVILVGIREDAGVSGFGSLTESEAPTVNDVISRLPRIRSGLSRRRVNGRYESLVDTADHWKDSIVSGTMGGGGADPKRWLRMSEATGNRRLRESIERTVGKLASPQKDRGANFIECQPDLPENMELYKWFIDPRLEGVCNHESRAHLDKDLLRYLYAASYAAVFGISPTLEQYPTDLLPDHKNARSGDFGDRFRVQVGNRPEGSLRFLSLRLSQVSNNHLKSLI